MQQERPTTVCGWTGDDRLMSVHEYLVENSISDQEHKELVAARMKQEIEDSEQADLFGADSIIEAQDQPKPKASKTDRLTTTSISSFASALAQTSMAI